MSIESYLENLRAKPEHLRKRYAFWTSFGVTALIFVFWLASFSSWGATSTQAVARVVESAGSPGQSMIAGVGSFLGDVKDMVFGPKKVTYGTVLVRPGVSLKK